MECLLSQRLPSGIRTEFVVVNDRSADHTADVLEELAAASPVPFRILNGAGTGVAAARNLACQHARGTWIASFDDDELASQDWLSNLLDCALKHNAACVGGSIRLAAEDEATLAQRGPRARRLLGEIPDSGAARPMSFKELPATGNVLMRREVFLALGGFDIRFRQGGEDTDLFQRMHRAGYSMWFAPAAEVLHRIPARRMEQSTLRQSALRTGAIETRLAAASGLWGALAKNLVLRCGLAVTRDACHLLAAHIKREPAKALDARLSMAVTEGLLRALPALRSENSAFLAAMDFRSRHGERAARQEMEQ